MASGLPDDRIDDLLAAWEDLREQGRVVTAEEICAGCPELAPELARRIRVLDAMERLVNLPPDPPRAGGEDGREDEPAPGVKAATCETHYGDLRFHAAGGLGEVFTAQGSDLNRRVALKFIKPERDRDAVSRRRFLFEAEVTARLEHPGVVPVYGLGTDDRDRPCYAMRFIGGRTLQEALEAFHERNAPRRDRDRAFRDLLRRFVSVCNTVAYAHSRGVLHRDLKPKNVMLGAFDETLVVDWGLARAFGRREGEATLEDPPPGGPDHAPFTADVVGTPGYLSPEQALGEPSTSASDVYSLGATLYALLTGRPPVQGSSVPDALERTRLHQFPPARAVNPAVAPALEAVAARALAARPADRYPDPLALAADVDRWLDDEPVSVYRDGLAARLSRWTRRHRARATAAVTLVLLGLGGATAAALISAYREDSLRKTVEARLARSDAEIARARADANSRRKFDNVMRAFLVVAESSKADAHVVVNMARELLSAMEATAKPPGGEADGERNSLGAIGQLRQAAQTLESLVREHPDRNNYRALLGSCYVKIGQIGTSFPPGSAEFDGAWAWYDKALSVVRPIADDPDIGPTARYQVGQALIGRYGFLLRSRRFTEALRAFNELAALDVPGLTKPGEFSRETVLKAAEMEQAELPWSRPPGENHAKAVAMADFLAAEKGVSLAAVYNAACVLSLASQDPRADADECERRAARAVGYLERIASADYFRGEKQLRELRADADLSPLRSRPDFRRITRRVGGGL
jgi:serine/threonine protein kinase